MQTSLFLFFDGRCAEAFRFYEKTLGARIETSMTYAETPGGSAEAANWQDKVMYACLKIGDSSIMASDAPPERSPGKPQGFYISLGADTPEEAERLFGELSAGGRVATAMSETFFAKRFGMATDRFGVPWMVVCQKQP